MKYLVILLFIPFTVFAQYKSFNELNSVQFPSPSNFAVFIEYVEMGGMGWTDCGGKILTAPDFCTRFSWTAPDLTLTEANLDGYRIYHETMGYFQVENCTACAEQGAYTGKLYVTACYSDPYGESEPSNVIEVSEELPIGTNDRKDNQDIYIIYRRESRAIELTDQIADIDCISLFDLYGRLLKTASESERMDVSGFSDGIYLIRVKYRNDAFASRKLYISK